MVVGNKDKIKYSYFMFFFFFLMPNCFSAVILINCFKHQLLFYMYQ